MSDKPDSDLDRYVAEQMESYYGSEMLRSVSRSVPPSLPYKRPNKWRVLAASLCAAAFLTGALMVTGVVFTHRIPASGSDTVQPNPVNSSTQSTNDSKPEMSSAQSTNDSKPEISSAESTNDSKAEISSAQGGESASDAWYPENAKSDTQTSSSERSHEYVLSEYEEQSGYILESEQPAPNGSVTTGDTARAGVGAALMLASLCGAVALYKERLE